MPLKVQSQHCAKQNYTYLMLIYQCQNIVMNSKYINREIFIFMFLFIYAFIQQKCSVRIWRIHEQDILIPLIFCHKSGRCTIKHPVSFRTQNSLYRPIQCLQTVTTFFSGRHPTGDRKWQFSSSSLWKPWNKRIKKVNLSVYFQILTLLSQIQVYILQFW